MSLSFVYVLQEEAIPELEIDVDELLDMQTDEDRAARVKVLRFTSSTCFFICIILQCFQEGLFLTTEYFFCSFTGSAGGLLQTY